MHVMSVREWIGGLGSLLIILVIHSAQVAHADEGDEANLDRRIKVLIGQLDGHSEGPTVSELARLGGRAVDPLCGALKSTSEPVRYNVVWALQQIGAAASRAAKKLCRVAQFDQSSRVRSLAILALPMIKAKAKVALPALCAILKSKQRRQWANAVFAIAEYKKAATKLALPIILSKVQTSGEQGRGEAWVSNAYIALAWLGSPAEGKAVDRRILVVLEAGLRSPDRWEKCSALSAAEHLGPSATPLICLIRPLVESKDEGLNNLLRRSAITCYASVARHDDQAVPYLKKRLKLETCPDLRKLIEGAIQRLDPKKDEDDSQER